MQIIITKFIHFMLELLNDEQYQIGTKEITYLKILRMTLY